MKSGGIMFGTKLVKAFAYLQLLFYKYETRDQCPCGGRFVLPTDHIELFQCLRCGTVSRRMRLTQFSTERLYRSSLYRRLLHGITKLTQQDFDRGLRRGNEIIKVLEKHNISVKDKNVMEIGSGPGGILAAFREQGAKVYGFDLDPICVSMCKQHNIPVNDGSFSSTMDIIILSHTLEHSYNPDEMIYDCMAWLANGGYLYIETPIYTPGQTAPLWHNYFFSKPALNLFAARLHMRPVLVEEGTAIFQWGMSNETSI